MVVADSVVADLVTLIKFNGQKWIHVVIPKCWDKRFVYGFWFGKRKKERRNT